jgi:hypothetical protein
MSSFKLFIDECLSPELVQIAVDAGHLESSCVSYRGLLGIKDWDLMTYVVMGDLTLVTHNARDFRGLGADRPGGLHAKEVIHAGLICLNSEIGMDFERQITLFRYALTALAGLPDLVNQALEVSEDTDGQVCIIHYDIPQTG